MKLRFRDHYSRRRTRIQRLCAFSAILSLLSVLLMATSRSRDAPPLGPPVRVVGVRDNQFVVFGLVLCLTGSGAVQRIPYPAQPPRNG
ncbi:flagellar biosynthesis protein FlgI, partial [Burkholderia thailandensis]|nr:flagellar biosynthesis protein FlgI [Burkholderia thailandensis]